MGKKIECACGCKTQIHPYDSKHRPRRFVNGHNRSRVGKSKYPRIHCAECHNHFTPLKNRKFCSRGCWRKHLTEKAIGCVWLGKNGYLYYQRGRKFKVLLHRLIAGAKPGEIVHHRNGDVLDNRVENLQILRGGQSEHIKLHNPVLVRWAKKHDASS